MHSRDLSDPSGAPAMPISAPAAVAGAGMSAAAAPSARIAGPRCRSPRCRPVRRRRGPCGEPCCRSADTPSPRRAAGTTHGANTLPRRPAVAGGGLQCIMISGLPGRRQAAAMSSPIARANPIAAPAAAANNGISAARWPNVPIARRPCRWPIPVTAMRPHRGRCCGAVWYPPDRGYSTSSTSTLSPVTRCDSAAAMNGSSSPSSTSPGAVEVTPVRRSLTS